MTDLTLSSAAKLPADCLSAETVESIKRLLITNKKIEDSNYSNALIALFPALLATLKSLTGVGRDRITCVETLVLWALRSAQIVQKKTSPDFLITLQQSLLDDNTLDFLFGYIVDYWNETGAPLSNALKDLFTKLVALVKHFDNAQPVFKCWCDRSLIIQKERRVIYYLIEALVKEIDEREYVLIQDPHFIDDSLALIGSNALGALIGRCLGALYKKLYIDDEHAQEWVDKYWDPVIAELRNTQLRGGVKHHLLPLLFQTSKVSFKIVVDKLRDDTELFISCLNIGKQLAIEEDPFPVIVSRDTVEKLLVCEQHKIKIFQLLTISSKTSRPVNSQVYDILRNYIGLFFVDVEVESRNVFIAYLKQFIHRLRDSAYALNRDATKLQKRGMNEEASIKQKQVEEAQAFLKWLLEFIKTQIIPGSPYQRLIAGLKVFTHILESNIDSKIPFKAEVDYPFKFDLFDDVYKRLLLDNVLSTYDDVREMAMSLLSISKSQWTAEEKEQIISKGFEMLTDYKRSDNGSKILEMSFKLFKDRSIFDRLVSEIPITSDIAKGVNKPVDGYFQSMALIMAQDNSVADGKQILQLCETNWKNVKGILIHDSPEGCDEYNVGSAQLVLSYGWRSTKESTLLLQQVLDLPLSAEDVISIGELTLDQLSTVRHRGAFASVYPTFIKVASVCKKSIPDQNQKWLDYNISLIQTKTQLITRRSGGLPYLVTAIVTVERDLFKYAFEKLLDIAEVPVNEKEESEKMDISQVHAFNCIKTLFVESQLSSACAPYIDRALELSLSTFSSKIWSVRNCSIMLFTALQNRLFGRKKLSARVFFSRYKGVKGILIKILKETTEETLETLFPALTILSKLENTPGYTGMDEFQPLIRQCLANKFWKIRECASWALPALVTDRVAETKLLLKECSIRDQNKLHGMLLAILTLKSVDAEVSKAVCSMVDEIIVNNPCYATRKSFVNVLALCDLDTKTREVLKEVFLHDNSIYEVDGSKQLYLRDLYELVLSKDLITTGLTSEFFEVKLKAIEYCNANSIEHPEIVKIAKDENEWTFVRSKAIPLIEDYEVEKVVEFATDQDKFGEEIKRSALELLGTVVVRESSYFNTWYELIVKASDEDEPFPVRMSALKSCFRFLKDKKDGHVEWLVYQFLTDDDDEIREAASNYFGEDVVPWYNAREFAERFGTSPEESHIVLNEILKFQPEFKTQTGEKVLFNVEKKNLYRSPVEQHEHLMTMLQNSWSALSQEDKSRLTTHFNSIQNRLISTITNAGKDSVLGWSTEETVFNEIHITLNYLRQLRISTVELCSTFDSVSVHTALTSLL